MGYHTVQQGEHAARIAQNYRFYDWQTVWNAPENAGLREKRKSPDVLMPGDSLYIPDQQPKEWQEPTDQRHIYRVKGRPLKLRLRIMDRFFDSISNAPCVFAVDGKVANMTTDGAADLDRPLTLAQQSAEDGSLQFNETLAVAGQKLARSVQMPLKLGHIDPPDEVSGQVKRLRNLGYYPLQGDEPDAKMFQAAIEEFQCENNLDVDGVCGPQTQAKLKQVYGC